MTSPQKKKRAKKVKAWALLTKRGAFLVTHPNPRKDAATTCFLDEECANIVPCTITYSLPPSNR